MRVTVLLIEHKHGLNTYVCATPKIAWQELYKYVREWWSTAFPNDIKQPECVDDPAPYIDDYFAEMENESYSLFEQEHVIGEACQECGSVTEVAYIYCPSCGCVTLVGNDSSKVRAGTLHRISRVIENFERVCEDEERTDTGDAWDLLHRIWGMCKLPVDASLVGRKRLVELYVLAPDNTWHETSVYVPAELHEEAAVRHAKDLVLEKLSMRHVVDVGPYCFWTDDMMESEWDGQEKD